MLRLDYTAARQYFVNVKPFLTGAGAGTAADNAPTANFSLL
jgi:hypothetical protein